MSFSFLHASGIAHTRENFDSPEVPLTADAIAPDESATLASAVSEITADEASLAGGNQQIDAAAVAADGLETLADQVAEANESGEGIDEATAGIVETSAECFLKLARIGISVKSIGMPSKEGFAQRPNRVALGKRTVEALDLSAKGIWKSIVDAIKKSIEWVRNFFNKIFGAAERLQKRAQALKDSTTKLTGQAEESTLENDSLYNSVRVKGQPVTVKDVQELGVEAKALFAAQKKTTDAFGAMSDLETVSPIVPKPSDYGLKPADGNNAKRVTAESDVAVFQTSVFPGESIVYLVVPKSEGGDAKGMSEAANKIRAGAVNVSEKKEEGKTLKVLPVDEIRGMAEAVEKAAGEVVEYKKNLTDITNNKTKFIAKLEKFLSKGSGRNEADSKSDAEKKAKASATIFRKLMDEPAASFASHSIRSLSACLQYAELSARKYETNN